MSVFKFFWQAALIVSAIALAACGKPRTNSCAGANTNHCVGQPVCAFDEKQGCQVCQCPGDSVDSFGKPDPNDRSQPPDTRRPDSY